MRMDPIGSFIWILSPQLVELPGKNQECGLGEGGELLEWVLGFKRLEPFPTSSLCLLVMSQDESSQLRTWCYACLPVAMIPTMTATDSHSETLSPK